MVHSQDVIRQKCFLGRQIQFWSKRYCFILRHYKIRLMVWMVQMVSLSVNSCTVEEQVKPSLMVLGAILSTLIVVMSMRCLRQGMQQVGFLSNKVFRGMLGNLKWINWYVKHLNQQKHCNFCKVHQVFCWDNYFHLKVIKLGLLIWHYH